MRRQDTLGLDTTLDFNKDLTGADLTDANLSGAIMKNASVSDEQLEATKSLIDATMPNGSIKDSSRRLDLHSPECTPQ